MFWGAYKSSVAFYPSSVLCGPARTPPVGLSNMSSISGRIAMPFVGPYAASKHALGALSDSLEESSSSTGST